MFVPAGERGRGAKETWRRRVKLLYYFFSLFRVKWTRRRASFNAAVCSLFETHTHTPSKGLMSWWRFNTRTILTQISLLCNHYIITYLFVCCCFNRILIWEVSLHYRHLPLTKHTLTYLSCSLIGRCFRKLKKMYWIWYFLPLTLYICINKSYQWK